MNPWLLASRPKTLPAAIVPVWVGSMPVLLDDSPATGSWLLFWCTLVGCLCIQIATNLFNDAIDHKKGADTEDRLGPTRVTATGRLSQKAVLGGALGFCVLAALIALPLVAARGWPIVVIGLVSLFFAYGYTGGPFPLAYRGMGEGFVILFFGFVAVLGSYFVQTGDPGGLPIWILGWQCGLYSAVLIAINNLRDVDEDRKTGKRTLAVRFGKTFARWEIAVFCVMALLLSILFLRDPGSPGFLLLTSAIAVVSAYLIRGVWRNEPSGLYNKFLALGAVQLILFGLLASLSFAGR
ncbi:MAG: 1,4-dihydroxy-2-naphthoate octaprenyltransferase [Verrucomicrobiales bacterium]